MNDDMLRTEIAGALRALEAELRRQQRWEASMPSPERMASEVPFCHDTLEFLQWVQWIFIPRFRAVLEGGHPLPASCAVAPAAEVALDAAAVETVLLLEHLRAIDQLVTGTGRRR